MFNQSNGRMILYRCMHKCCIGSVRCSCMHGLICFNWCSKRLIDKYCIYCCRCDICSYGGTFYDFWNRLESRHLIVPSYFIDCLTYLLSGRNRCGIHYIMTSWSMKYIFITSWSTCWSIKRIYWRQLNRFGHPSTLYQ